jgi:small subunit ribosomal protein S8
MSMNDLMSDYVARVNNAAVAGNDEVSVLKNKLSLAVTNKLTKLGYFDSYEDGEYNIKITLKPEQFSKIKRISKPGQRQYVGYESIPKIIGGKGFSILTTSKGVLTQVEAKKEKVGGEVLFQIY